MSYAQAAAAPIQGVRRSVAVQPLLRGTLFLAILLSGIVLIEPAPYELLMAVLLVLALVARVCMPRLVGVLVLLLALWNVGGLLSLANIPGKSDAVIFVGTSIYLSCTAILFACLFAEDTVRRIAVLRTGFIFAALLAAAVGIAAYFNLFPGAAELTLYGRARSTFKDPNVYAPFLVLPLLFLIETSLRERIRIMNILGAGLLAAALLLAFSRGAWANAAVSAVIMMALMFVTAGGNRLRGRIIFVGAISIAALAALVVLLVSFESVGELFAVRAVAVQAYDVGEAGRFGNQLRSIPYLLERPNGFGPLEFMVIFPQAPHNVYVNAFASYGWLGGISYILMIAVSLWLGLRYVLIRTPWRPAFIAVYAAFCGTVLEGAVVDTDHWRHFFLLLGAVWGLSAATAAELRTRPIPPLPPMPAARAASAPPVHLRVSRIG